MGKNNIFVRTAQELEKKYNFASLLGLKKNVEITRQGIQKIENELNNILTALVINLKDVLDSQSDVSLWFYSGTPTKLNAPYINWVTPSDHTGDIYYDQSTGRVYQYNNDIWEVNTNPDLVEAMAITNAELDTQDHERKVFFTTPTIPYSNGDWWIKTDGTLFICQISKTSGIYEEDDFISSENYTQSVAEKIGDEIKVLKGTITTMSESYAKFTDLATGGSTTIAGENISTGSIQSNNYIQNTSGTKINLTDGSIDSKNFKLDSGGNMSCSNLDINLTSNNISIDSQFLDVKPSGLIEMNDVQDQSAGDSFIKMYSGKGLAYEHSANYSSSGIYLSDPGIQSFGYGYTSATASLTAGKGLTPRLYMSCDGSSKSGETNGFLIITHDEIYMRDDDTYSYSEITPNGITTPSLTQTSLEDKKKNFEKFENGLGVIKDIDIYKYHLKDQEDTEKKHIGFVIGDKYKYSQEITNNENDGVDIYSFVAVCCKAIQEQQKQIEELKNMIGGLDK